MIYLSILIILDGGARPDLLRRAIAPGRSIRVFESRHRPVSSAGRLLSVRVWVRVALLLRLRRLIGLRGRIRLRSRSWLRPPCRLLLPEPLRHARLRWLSPHLLTLRRSIECGLASAAQREERGERA